jgi:hypothetical protein
VRSLLCLVLVGCGGSAFEFQPAAGLPSADTQRYKDAAAVVLQRDVGVYVKNDPGRTQYTEYRQHSLIHILSEAGFDHAEVRMDIGEDSELLYLYARTIAPDGSIQSVTPKEVLEDDAKVGSTSKTKVKQKVFRFPAVSVGSRIEYAYATGHRWVWSWDLGRLCDRLPIEKYNLEIAVHKNVVSSLAIFNRDQTFKRSQDGAVTYFTTSFANLPPIEDGWFPQPWQDREPWWAFRVNRLVFGNNYRLLNDTWERTLSYVARNLYLETEDWTRGFTPPAKITGCGEDKRCTLEKSLAALHKDVRFKGFVSNMRSARELKQAMESKEANNFELAMIAHRVLAENGIEAKYALVGRSDGLVFEREFPLPNQFDHLLLFIPAQSGFVTPVFIDPACEQCAVGQLSSWVQGKEAIVISGEHSVNDGVSVSLDWRPVRGSAPMAPATHRSYQVKVNGSDIEGRAVIVSEGSDAVNGMIEGKRRTDKQKRERWDEWLKNRAKTGEVLSYTDSKCDRQNARCSSSVDFRVPVYLVADGEGFVLPLELAYSGFDDSKRALAKGRLHAWNDDLAEDTMEVELPKGLSAKVMPKPVKLKTSMVEVECETTPTAAGFRFHRVLKIKQVDVPAAQRDEVQAALNAYSQCRKEVVGVGKETKRTAAR